ncbi:MAG: IS110 family transposase [Hyphomicrobiaceae bacterium]|nr:IS110 family transposase [Hyphomicrobiaceae bacterium]
MTQAARKTQDSAEDTAVFVSMELSKKSWKLAFSDVRARRPRVVAVPARDWDRFDEAVRKAKERFGLPSDAPVRSCYEAGRDGFWIHRLLSHRGIENVVVDSASIEVNRRSRRAKTDRLDAEKLVTQLIRHHEGERVWSVVRVPDVPDEDARHLHRDLEVLKSERRNHRMRIQSLLFTHGIDQKVGRKFLEVLPTLHQWDGQPLPSSLKVRLVREYQRSQMAEEQIRELEKERKVLLESSRTKAVEKARLMAQLCGIGATSSWVFVLEFFAWRQFANRREVAAAAGLTPTPYDSGDSPREQGISKAGNPRVRTMMIEIAWSWLRYQPDSKLSKWFWERFGKGSARQRRVGIVAVARRLLIDLWRLVEFGIVPDGARLKTA